MLVKPLLAAGMLLLPCLMVPSPGWAAAAASDERPQTVVNTTHGPLSLEVSPYPLTFKDLTPGDSVAWTVTPKLKDGLSGPLSLQILSDGPLAKNDAGARLTLRRCSEPWAQEHCPSGGTLIVDAPLSRIDPETVHDLGFLSPEQGAYFHASFTMPVALPEHLQDSSATFGLGFAALGDEENVISPPSTNDVPRGRLPYTGADGLLGVFALGLLLALAGMAMRFHKPRGADS
ncbi:hypothetical protein [Arthrobacter crystallopoietes]|uniref:hypothetical protein n=1 Tax=Crystallibacter crystallopoietes TaxID=37928 RepID=UPI0011115571|nr:hypothetical protein [Arthrobacter crystallopoietes]